MTATTATIFLPGLLSLLHAINNVNAIPPACFAVKRGGGGTGFGVSKPKTVTPSPPTTTTKVKNKKGKSGILLEELKNGPPPSSETTIQNNAPKLDRFGLPIITEDDVFPPLSRDIPRVPVHDENSVTRETIALSMENHLGINLDIFDEHGYSLHTETSTTNNGELLSTKWKLRLLHFDPPVFTVDNFFSPQECQTYKSMVDPADRHHDPSKTVRISSPTFSSSSVSRRTSTTWFCRYDAVPTLLAKASRLLRRISPSQCEEPQIVRYRTGEEFSWHYDEIPESQLTNGGQRVATLLVYLNDLEEGRGGGTVFRDLTPPSSSSGEETTERLTVRPVAGKALLFFPSYKDGTADVRTLHRGEVALDTKMIAQLWIHEGEYRASVPLGNRQEDALEKVEEENIRLGFV